MESGPSIGLDDFSLLRVIGRGSYAKVFVVEQKRTKRVYAMKVIKKELVNDDEVKFRLVWNVSCVPIISLSASFLTQFQPKTLLIRSNKAYRGDF